MVNEVMMLLLSTSFFSSTPMPVKEGAWNFWCRIVNLSLKSFGKSLLRLDFPPETGSWFFAMAEICFAATCLGKSDKLNWDLFLLDTRKRGCNKEDDHKSYKRRWKRSFRSIAKDLKFCSCDQDNWRKILEDLPEPYTGSSSSSKGVSSSTSSLNYQKKYNAGDYAKMEEIFKKMGAEIGCHSWRYYL